MKTKIIYFLYWLGHYTYAHRSEIFKFCKAYYKSGNVNKKVSIYEFLDFCIKHSKPGYIEDDSDNMYSGALILNGTEIKQNTSKNLVLTEQKGRECVPNTLFRVANYNNNFCIDIETQKKYIQEMYKKGILIDGQGSKVSDVIDFIKNKIKLDYGKDVIYLREKIGTEKYKQLVEAGYVHATGGGISEKYLTDLKMDGIINQDYNFKEKILYGHFFMFFFDRFVDNYKDTLGDKNIYKNPIYLDFINNSVFYKYAYFILPNDVFTQDTAYLAEQQRIQAEILKIKINSNDSRVINDIEILKKYIKAGYSCLYRVIDKDYIVTCEIFRAKGMDKYNI